MEDFRFRTKEPLYTNADIMDCFINEHFYEVFDADTIYLKYDDGYAEAIDSKWQKWGLHASSDDDLVSHRIRFEALTKYWY